MSHFTDIQHLPADVQDAIEWCRKAGISNGTSDTTFTPDAGVTRWQMAVFMHRIAQSITAGFDVLGRAWAEENGYTKPPKLCLDCQGVGMQWTEYDPRYPSVERTGRTCRSCGGTGKADALDRGQKGRR